jgi:hypothetical protein
MLLATVMIIPLISQNSFAQFDNTNSNSTLNNEPEQDQVNLHSS